MNRTSKGGILGAFQGQSSFCRLIQLAVRIRGALKDTTHCAKPLSDDQLNILRAPSHSMSLSNCPILDVHMFAAFERFSLPRVFSPDEDGELQLPIDCP